MFASAIHISAKMHVRRPTGLFITVQGEQIIDLHCSYKAVWIKLGTLMIHLHVTKGKGPRTNKECKGDPNDQKGPWKESGPLKWTLLAIARFLC